MVHRCRKCSDIWKVPFGKRAEFQIPEVCTLFTLVYQCVVMINVLTVLQEIIQNFASRSVAQSVQNPLISASYMASILKTVLHVHVLVECCVLWPQCPPAQWVRRPLAQWLWGPLVQRQRHPWVQQQLEESWPATWNATLSHSSCQQPIRSRLQTRLLEAQTRPLKSLHLRLCLRLVWFYIRVLNHVSVTGS